MHIIRAEIQDFKRISVAAIDAGGIVEITGGNGHGKSSVLDAIEAALAGKDHAPQEPIRRGAEKARVVLDLGDLVVERVWTKKSDRIVVKNREGASYPRPQERLSALVGGLAFDPLGFMSLKPAEQRATLLRIIGVDLESFAARREVVFQRRTGTNRDLKAAKARLDGVPEVPADVPDEEVSVADLSELLRKAMEQKQQNDFRRQAATGKEDALQLARTRVRQAGEEVQRLEAALKAAREALTGLEGEAEAAADAAQQARAAADAIADPDLAAIQEQIGAADATNRLVRQKQQRAALVQEVERLAAAAIADTAAIEAIDQEQEAALAGASVPVAGLGVNDDGVTFNGLPLDQASGMERIRACTAIGAALNPELKIALIRQGNDMEPKHLAAFYAECQAHGLQAWVERISGIGSDAIVIEEGVVVGAADATDGSSEEANDGQG